MNRPDSTLNAANLTSVSTITVIGAVSRVEVQRNEPNPNSVTRQGYHIVDAQPLHDLSTMALTGLHADCRFITPRARR